MYDKEKKDKFPIALKDAIIDEFITKKFGKDKFEKDDTGNFYFPLSFGKSNKEIR